MNLERTTICRIFLEAKLLLTYPFLCPIQFSIAVTSSISRAGVTGLQQLSTTVAFPTIKRFSPLPTISPVGLPFRLHMFCPLLEVYEEAGEDEDNMQIFE
jgi:hypothetical protein